MVIFWLASFFRPLVPFAFPLPRKTISQHISETDLSKVLRERNMAFMFPYICAIRRNSVSNNIISMTIVLFIFILLVTNYIDVIFLLKMRKLA